MKIGNWDNSEKSDALITLIQSENPKKNDKNREMEKLVALL